MEGDKGGLWLPAVGWLLEGGGGAGWLVTVFFGAGWRTGCELAGYWCGLHSLIEGGWMRLVVD